MFVTTAVFNQVVDAARGMFSGLGCLLFGGEAESGGRIVYAVPSSFAAQLLNSIN